MCKFLTICKKLFHWSILTFKQVKLDKYLSSNMLTLKLKSGILQIVQLCVLTFNVFEKKC